MIFCVFVLLTAIVLFSTIIIIRTFNFKTEVNVQDDGQEVTFDRNKAIENLRELIRYKTVSYKDHSLEDDSQFKMLISAMPRLYPNVLKACEFKQLADRALLFKWKGKSELKPTVLMAHYDVVPVDENGWDKPAFEGILEDGVIWGRGSLDTKVTFNGVMFAADKMIADGFIPENDIYLAFSGGEEVNGNGAVNIVNFFIENDIHPNLVIDEGGAVVENVFPGVKGPCALIGIAEKGMMNVEYKCKSNGGHASAPKPNTSVVKLCKACCKLEAHPFKPHLTKPVAEMFDTLGRHSSFVYRMIFANLWAFGGILNIICKKSGGELNALMRTTVAFTQMSGSLVANVLPPEAKMISNIRLNPEDTIDSALEYIKNTVEDDDIEINVLYGTNPSTISKTDCAEWNMVASSVVSTWKDSKVSPYLMVQCSDSRHYGKICDKVYRFSAIDLTAQERATIHGNNERIRVEAAERAVEFYIRLINKC